MLCLSLTCHGLLASFFTYLLIIYWRSRSKINLFIMQSHMLPHAVTHAKMLTLQTTKYCPNNLEYVNYHLFICCHSYICSCAYIETETSYNLFYCLNSLWRLEKNAKNILVFDNVSSRNDATWNFDVKLCLNDGQMATPRSIIKARSSFRKLFAEVAFFILCRKTNYKSHYGG